ncbi:hypothetical protein QG37_06172 [Candidozyma auris]|uniref:Uncharacterized protein n=1 Tax=Candidozyma auris TaxID=498019 RepID=A0A0L0NU95_CANAR|nr:hypothetical protein QG37_06172 [[Candida] auris]
MTGGWPEKSDQNSIVFDCGNHPISYIMLSSQASIPEANACDNGRWESEQGRRNSQGTKADNVRHAQRLSGRASSNDPLTKGNLHNNAWRMN